VEEIARAEELDRGFDTRGATYLYLITAVYKRGSLSNESIESLPDAVENKLDITADIKNLDAREVYR
jgi:hypothetical protein